MSENELLSALKASELLKESEKSFDKTRIEKIREKLKELRDKCSKSKINEISRNLYEIENERNSSALRIKEIEKYLLELEKNLFKSKKYYDYDDTEYKRIRSIRNLLDLSVDEDYYKPIITNSAFNSNYIQYESMGCKDKDKNLLIKEYLDKIKPYLSDMIDNHKAQGKTWRVYSGNTIIECKTQGGWKIQLTIKINFISSMIDSDETRTMRTKCDNRDVMLGSETDEIIEEHFKSLLQKYQEELKESMGGSYFIFDSADALYYDLNKIILSRGGSYIDSPAWLANKKAAINPKNKDDKCFQYALTVALNCEQIKKYPQKLSNIKPFIDKYNWKERTVTSYKKDWKKFELNNKSIALNILYVPYNTKEIRCAYKSKYNLKRENQVILLMIIDGKKWHYLAVRKLSAVLRGITSKHEGDIYCLNCFRSYSTKNKLKKHKDVYENHDYCYVEVPEEDDKILKYNHGEKSIKAPFIIYADLESLLEKNEHLS